MAPFSEPEHHAIGEIKFRLKKYSQEKQTAIEMAVCPTRRDF
jgi:hypothetical protein